ncbi:hypothetical protein ACCO45_012686 [Purpureocillium lilacinum]|uniref:Uncharacterized protein n=1 Tax=Purpureocillium lilacinum TaxID=33203 RepID=A0ACC4D9Q8_PURLI
MRTTVGALSMDVHSALTGLHVVNSGTDGVLQMLLDIDLQTRTFVRQQQDAIEATLLTPEELATSPRKQLNATDRLIPSTNSSATISGRFDNEAQVLHWDRVDALVVATVINPSTPLEPSRCRGLCQNHIEREKGGSERVSVAVTDTCI